MSACICRTDPKTGLRWTNTACRQHGIPSSAEDIDSTPQAQIERLMGTTE